MSGDSGGQSSRLLHYLINNIREHLMLYLFLWGLLAIMDLIYVFYF
ncbi:DUF2770 family protein [Escherichia coli]|nr:DUF2770 family protein [Escherichia coli]MBM9396191.1 YceO family protein [Escherichia coli]